MAVYVMVPGAWLGGWAWDEVAAGLRERGHEVHPVTLSGLGDRADPASRDVDLGTHVTDIVRVIEDKDLHDVLLVGHSYAMFSAPGELAETLDRLAS